MRTTYTFDSLLALLRRDPPSLPVCKAIFRAHNHECGAKQSADHRFVNTESADNLCASRMVEHSITAVHDKIAPRMRTSTAFTETWHHDISDIIIFMPIYAANQELSVTVLVRKIFILNRCTGL